MLVYHKYSNGSIRSYLVQTIINFLFLTKGDIEFLLWGYLVLVFYKLQSKDFFFKVCFLLKLVLSRISEYSIFLSRLIAYPLFLIYLS